MPRSPSRLVRYPFMLAVAAALAFGAQSAAAGTTTASSCKYDPPNGYFALSCTPGAAGDSYCNQWCQQNVGSWSSGYCGDPSATNCCVCAV